MLKIAITGNIASGKSLAESYIGQYYPVYDSDKFAHEVLDSLNEFYGYDVFTAGKIDRTKLAGLVFSNQDIKDKLENIVHPKVKLMIEDVFKKHKNEKFVFVSVPLLYEAGFETMFDKVIFIEVDETEQLYRLMKRNNLSEEEAFLRINSQLHQAEKISRADYVIKNDSTPEVLESQIKTLLKTLEQ